MWLIHYDCGVVPLRCYQEHEEFEKFFPCNDLLFQLLPCHSELHKEVGILRPGPPAKKKKYHHEFCEMLHILYGITSKL